MGDKIVLAYKASTKEAPVPAEFTITVGAEFEQTFQSADETVEVDKPHGKFLLENYPEYFEAVPVSAVEEKDFSELSKTELVAEAAARGLSTEGNKQVLLERLQLNVVDNANESDKGTPGESGGEADIADEELIVD